MKDILDKNTWDTPYAKLGWGSLCFALASSIVFFAAYGGTAWWVVYYSRPDGQISTDKMSFGLFRMCIRGDCIIDITNKRIVLSFAPSEMQSAMLTALPASQWLMSFDVAFIIILFLVYLAFLAGENTYYAEVWLQFIICALIVTSVAVFGAHFNISAGLGLPFGWSFWLGVVAAAMFFLNALAMAFITTAVRSKASLSKVALIRKQQEAESQA